MQSCVHRWLLHLIHTFVTQVVLFPCNPVPPWVKLTIPHWTTGRLKSPSMKSTVSLTNWLTTEIYLILYWTHTIPEECPFISILKCSFELQPKKDNDCLRIQVLPGVVNHFVILLWCRLSEHFVGHSPIINWSLVPFNKQKSGSLDRLNIHL